MAEITGITWTDSTFNPWIGCTKIGQGCDHCYAEHLMDTRLHRVNWGPGQPRRRTQPQTWRKPGKWNAEPFCECMRCGWRGPDRATTTIHNPVGFHPPVSWARGCPACNASEIKEARRRVFCASLADVFDNEVDPAWRAELFALIAGTPNLDYLLLTKRIGNVAKMIEAPGMQKCGLPPNVWLGITVVNQAEADRDIPKLLATPARVRFLSIEPMLGPIDLTHIRKDRFWRINALAGDYWREEEDEAGFRSGETFERVSQVHWVIVGGESGAHARPFHVDWARLLVQQCEGAGVPVHVKQLGAKPSGWSLPALDKAGANWDEWPEDLRVREWPALEGER